MGLRTRNGSAETEAPAGRWQRFGRLFFGDGIGRGPFPGDVGGGGTPGPAAGNGLPGRDATAPGSVVSRTDLSAGWRKPSGGRVRTKQRARPRSAAVGHGSQLRIDWVGSVGEVAPETERPPQVRLVFRQGHGPVWSGESLSQTFSRTEPRAQGASGVSPRGT